MHLLLLYILAIVSLVVNVDADARAYVGNRIPAPTLSVNYDYGTTISNSYTFNYTAYAGSGAIGLAGQGNALSYSSANPLDPSGFGRTYASTTIRIVFQLPTSIPLSKTLVELAPVSSNGYDNVIRIIADGYQMSSSDVSRNNTKSVNENNLLLRVYNNGYSCTSSPVGRCVLDFPGLLLPAVWHDLIVTVDAFGVASVYMNATLVGRANGYKFASPLRYQAFVGASSFAGVTDDSAQVLFRAFDVYNISLNEKQVRDVSLNRQASLLQAYSRFYDDNLAQANYNTNNMFYQNDNVFDPLYADPIDTSTLQIPLTPETFVYDFNDKSTFTVDNQFNNASVVLVQNASYVMDALNSPNKHGIVIPDNSSYIALSSNNFANNTFGGPFSLNIEFKFNANNPVRQNTVIFACSALNNGIEVNRIDLVTATSSPDLLTFSITLGDHTRYSMTVNTSANLLAQPIDALGWRNVLIVVDTDGTTSFYNHGYLLSTSILALPYLASRPLCYLGKNTGVPFNRANAVTNYFNVPTNMPTAPPCSYRYGCPTAAPPDGRNLTFVVPVYSSFIGAIARFVLLPKVIPYRQTSQFLLANYSVSVPFDQDWSTTSVSFSAPYFVPDELITTSVLRNGAYWAVNSTSASSSLSPSPSSVVSTPAASPFQSASSSEANNPGSTTLAQSMNGDGQVIPIVNQFQGGIKCVNGGYLNMGSLAFGGDLTLRLQLRLLRFLNQSATLFSSGNRLTSIQDHLVVAVGNVQPSGGVGDLVITVSQNGYKCTASTSCSFTLVGALHAERDLDIIIIFNSGTTTVYIDGRIVGTSTTLLHPSKVIREYSFIGYSYSGAVQDMYVYAMSLSSKPLSKVDVSTLNPSLATSYQFQFSNNDTSTYFSDPTLGYPVVYSWLAQSIWSEDPFQIEANGLPVDGTSAVIANRKPTTGLYFLNAPATVARTNLNLAQAQWNGDNATYTSLLAQASTLTSTLNTLSASLSALGVIVSSTPSTYTTTFSSIAAFLTTLPAPLTSSSSFMATVPLCEQQLMNVTTLTSALNVNDTVLVLPLLEAAVDSASLNCGFMYQSAKDVYNQLLQSNAASIRSTLKLLVADSASVSTLNAIYVSANAPQYVDLGSLYIGGEFSMRLKTRVGTFWTPGSGLSTSNNGTVILDITSGNRVDAILVSVSGPMNAVTVTLTINRGTVAQSITSAPMDSTIYWLDLYFTLDTSGNVKIYNWGQLISYGVMWLPIPGFRSHAYVGATSLQNGGMSYAYNATFEKFQFSPTIMTSSDIQGIYTYDKPPLAVPTLLGAQYIIDTSLPSSFVWRAPNDILQNCLCCEDALGGGNCETECGPYISQHIAAVVADASAPTLLQFPPRYNSNFLDFLLGSPSAQLLTGNDILGKVIYTYQHGYISEWDETNPIYWEYLNFRKRESSIPYGFSHIPRSNGRYDNMYAATLSISPFYDFGALVRRAYLTPVNTFTDAAIATVEGNVITAVIWYEPTLIEYNNQASSIASAFSVHNMADVDKGIAGLCMDNPPNYACNKDNNGNYNPDRSFTSFADDGRTFFINPPQVMFQYGTWGNSGAPNPQTSGGPTFPASLSTQDSTVTGFMGANLFSTDYGTTLSSAQSLKLSQGEYITSIKSWCNYRFEFITNLGNVASIGNFYFLKNLTSCISSPVNTFKGASSSPVAVSTPDIQDEPGYALQYMEGTRGGMYNWTFHWVQQPTSYYMYNINFDFDASTALTNTKPSQAISLDLYNHSPIAQTCWMVHSMSVTTEENWSNTDTSETNWQWGVSLSVSVTYSPPGETGGWGGGPTIGGSGGMGGSSSSGHTYGGSNSTTQDDTQMLMANVPPNSKVTANLLAFSGSIDIPYTADVLITYLGGESEHIITNGIYNNVRTTAIIVTYSDAKPISNNTPLGS